MIAFAVADSGFFVVNGYVEISEDDRVAELKNVVLPVLVLPIIPIFMGTSTSMAHCYLSLTRFSGYDHCEDVQLFSDMCFLAHQLTK